MSTNSDSESDIEIKTVIAPRKFVKKPPQIPQQHSTDMKEKEIKKLTTKQMIVNALKEQKSRKGISLQAIKKYMVDYYQVDTEKINFYIKKYIKSGVSDGSIVQVKGVGASGSFRLAPVKKPEKKLNKNKNTEKAKEKPEKKNEKAKVEAEKSKKVPKEKKKEMPKEKKQSKKEKLIVGDEKVKKTKEKKVKVEKSTKMGKMKAKSDEKTKSPSKKKAGSIIKRKSIGSIIKPPKMKPKMREK